MLVYLICSYDMLRRSCYHGCHGNYGCHGNGEMPELVFLLCYFQTRPVNETRHLIEDLRIINPHRSTHCIRKINPFLTSTRFEHTVKD